MASTRRVALLLIASLILTAAPVYAGGGGGVKRPSQIIFVDNSSDGIAVTTDSTNTLITEVLAETPPIQTADWLRAGGKFASVNQKAKFSVTAGTYGNVGVTDQAFANTTLTTTSVTIGAGQTIYVIVTDGGGGPGTFTLTLSATP